MERRSEDRLRAPLLRESRVWEYGALLNLSEGGFAVEVPQKCRFARGEAHRLSLRVGSGNVEVDGTVRWTLSHWREREDAKGTVYRQLAGFELLEPVSNDTLSILEIMRNLVKDIGVGVEVRDSKPLDKQFSADLDYSFEMDHNSGAPS